MEITVTRFTGRNGNQADAMAHIDAIKAKYSVAATEIREMESMDEWAAAVRQLFQPKRRLHMEGEMEVQHRRRVARRLIAEKHLAVTGSNIQIDMRGAKGYEAAIAAILAV